MKVKNNKLEKSINQAIEASNIENSNMDLEIAEKDNPDHQSEDIEHVMQAENKGEA